MDQQEWEVWFAKFKTRLSKDKLDWLAESKELEAAITLKDYVEAERIAFFIATAVRE